MLSSNGYTHFLNFIFFISNSFKKGCSSAEDCFKGSYGKNTNYGLKKQSKNLLIKLNYKAYLQYLKPMYNNVYNSKLQRKKIVSVSKRFPCNYAERLPALIRLTGYSIVLHLHKYLWPFVDFFIGNLKLVPVLRRLYGGYITKDTPC